MVLDHVAQRAGLIVITSPRPDPFVLRDRDLHMVDVLLIEQRFEEAVREAQHQNVLNGLLSEIVIDAVDLAFVEHAGDGVVDGHRAREIASDRLLDDHASEGAGVCAVRRSAPARAVPPWPRRGSTAPRGNRRDFPADPARAQSCRVWRRASGTRCGSSRSRVTKERTPANAGHWASSIGRREKRCDGLRAQTRDTPRR